MLSQKERDGTMFLIGRYIALLQVSGVAPQQNDSERVGPGHTFWMLIALQQALLDENPKFDDGKVGRWIGYIQANLAIMNMINPTHEADITRPFFGR